MSHSPPSGVVLITPLIWSNYSDLTRPGPPNGGLVLTQIQTHLLVIWTATLLSTDWFSKTCAAREYIQQDVGLFDARTQRQCSLGCVAVLMRRWRGARWGYHESWTLLDGRRNFHVRAIRYWPSPSVWRWSAKRSLFAIVVMESRQGSRYYHRVSRDTDIYISGYVREDGEMQFQALQTQQQVWQWQGELQWW